MADKAHDSPQPRPGILKVFWPAIATWVAVAVWYALAEFACDWAERTPSELDDGIVIGLVLMMAFPTIYLPPVWIAYSLYAHREARRVVPVLVNLTALTPIVWLFLIFS